MKLYLSVFLLIFTSTVFANIALISYHPEFRNVDLNMSKLEKFADKAIADGATVVVFAEGAIDGYGQLDNGDDWTAWSRFIETWCSPDRVRSNCHNIDEVAQSINNDDILKYWQKYAQDNDIHLIFQIPEKEGDLYYNSAYVVNKDGFIAKHRKNNLFTSDLGFATPGKSGTVVKLPFGEVGIFICADGHSVELFEEYAKKNIFKYIGLGYGIYPPMYGDFSKQYNLRGLIVDSSLYMGYISNTGTTNIDIDHKQKSGYALFDYDFNFIKSVEVKSAK